jgi:hypothetical protein
MGSECLYVGTAASLTCLGCYAETNENVYFFGNTAAATTNSINGGTIMGNGTIVWGVITYFTS